MSSRRSFMKACALGFAGLSGAFALADFAGEKSLGRSGDLSGNLGDLAEFGENSAQNLAKFSRVFIKDAWIKDTPHFEADLALEIDGDISQIYTPLKKAFAANAVIIGLGGEASFFVLSQMGRDFGFRVAEYGLVATGGNLEQNFARNSGLSSDEFLLTQNGLPRIRYANSRNDGVVGVNLVQNSAQIQGLNLTQNVNLRGIYAKNANLSQIQGLNSVKNTNLNSKFVDCFGSLCEPRNDGVGVNLAQNQARIQGLNSAENTNLGEIQAINSAQNANLGEIQTLNSPQNDNTTIITSNSARFFILAPKGVKL